MFAVGVMNIRSLLILTAMIVSTAGSGCGTNAPETRDQGVTPTPAASVANQTSSDARTVKIESADKALLIGTFFTAEKPNSPALLLLHQWQSDRHSYDDFAKQMQAKGFCVLSIDGRGFGGSTRTSDGKTIAPERTEAAVKAMLGDVDAAFDFLSKQENVDPSRIGVVGASYGSSLALIYAADEPKIAAVALLSPGLNYFGNMPTEPAVKRYGERPLFMVAAEDDKESADCVRQLATADKAARQMIYPSGGHGTELFKVPATDGRPVLSVALYRFLDQVLIGGATTYTK